MKHIDYLYFNIYSYFHRISQFQESANARIQAMYLFSLGSGGWLLMLQSLFLHFVKHTRFSSRIESTIFAVAIYMLTAALSNYIYIVKHRDLMIFGKYEDRVDEHPKRRLHFILSIAVLLLPYAVLMSFSLIFPRHSQ
jgi:hypothetical protein